MNYKVVLLSTLTFGTSLITYAQNSKSILADEKFEKKGYSLVFKNNDPSFSPIIKQKLVDAYFEVYPKEVKKYNKKSAHDVVFQIDTAYDGVAATGGAHTVFNPRWFDKMPEDIDVVTHECMHIVQGYPKYEPIWMTEGIADYVRATMGINNEKANWKLPAYNAKQSYRNSYRITARFFVWLTKNYKKDLIVKLDAARRDGSYTPSFWTQQTGNTLDELWTAYSKNPNLNMKGY